MIPMASKLTILSPGTNPRIMEENKSINDDKTVRINSQGLNNPSNEITIAEKLGGNSAPVKT